MLVVVSLFGRTVKVYDEGKLVKVRVVKEGRLFQVLMHLPRANALGYKVRIVL
jgi:hypothetical protein